jgi:heat shock protein HslJ
MTENTMFKRSLALLAVVALMGQGCAATPSVNTPPSTPSGSANGAGQGSGAVGVDNQKVVGAWKLGAWKKPAAGEKLQDVSKLDLTLTLGADGKLSAKICNNMSGDYSLQKGKLIAPQVVSTRMFCEGMPGEVEAAFAADLAGGMSANADSESLTMTGLTSLNVYMFGKE